MSKGKGGFGGERGGMKLNVSIMVVPNGPIIAIECHLMDTLGGQI